MENRYSEIRPIMYLVYSRSIDTRISLLLANIGFTVRPICNINKFVETHSSYCDGAVLIDVAMDHEQGVALVAGLTSSLQRSIVISICSNASIDFCRRCFKAGVADVLDKSFDDQVITDALISFRDTSCMSKATSVSEAYRPELFDKLTVRGRQVFGYILDGLTSREIAQVLSLSLRTVECHRASLNRKLEVRNLAQMVRDYGYLCK